MYLFDNPVLQRELLVNLRMKRAFVLLLLYQVSLGAVVLLAWPTDVRLAANSDQARGLVNMFFLWQYVLASLMAPSFAAATITGEKERKTYEMLLASPLEPKAICLGKLISSLAHIGLLIIASSPIVMLCLPLGGVSIYDVLAAYLGLLLSVITFGMISLTCSSYFRRTAAALLASYLLILPIALSAIGLWLQLEFEGLTRLRLVAIVAPLISLLICVPLFWTTARRLLRSPDVGSEGKEVVDIDQEATEVVGLYIQRDQFPDRLFAPPKRNTLMPDNANPVYDKEIYSEIFAQGTLMLRLVIQISMLLAVPIMGVTLFIYANHAAWYVSYVVLFNMLVGPVYSAGSVTSERERQTLDLLLTTTVTPWKILAGKLIASLRISSGLSALLVWPLLLAIVMVPYFYSNLLGVAAFFAILVCTGVTTALVGLFCSVQFQKTTTSLMTTFSVIVLLFCLPVAAHFLAITTAPVVAEGIAPQSPLLDVTRLTQITSPFAAAFSVPLSADVEVYGNETPTPDRFFPGNWRVVAGFIAFSICLNLCLFGLVIWMFQRRWRVAQE